MTSTPEPLPSLPPSPRPGEEDVAQAWHEDEPSRSDAKAPLNPIAVTARRMRKGKGRAGDESEEDENEDEDEDEEDVDEVGRLAAGYPPTKEEEAEARIVAENLRRWEIAERQRRKAARESLSATTNTNNSPSLFADLFRRDSRKVPLGGVGTHHALATTDDGVPLEELSDTPTIDHPSPPTREPENPFDTPAASRTSLNVPAHSAIMSESDTLPDELASHGNGNGDGSGDRHLKVPKRPTLQASSSSSFSPTKKRQQPPPPPKPLDLPPPREPPHTDADPDKQPQSVPQPSSTAGGRREMEEERPPVRWWHEWLCGCGEGADRGGDNQAGRTNPFE